MFGVLNNISMEKRKEGWKDVWTETIVHRLERGWVLKCLLCNGQLGLNKKGGMKGMNVRIWGMANLFMWSCFNRFSDTWEELLDFGSWRATHFFCYPFGS